MFHRKCYARPNGYGVVVDIGEGSEHLTWSEAITLCECLLRIIPHVPERVSRAWDLRHTATIRVRAYYAPVLEQQTVAIDRYQGEVYVMDRCILRTGFHPTTVAAVEAAREAYGDELVYIDTYDCPGSARAAEEQLIRALVEQLAAAEGKTVAQLLAEQNAWAGGLTP